MSDSNWHYAQGQQSYGPIPLATLRDLAARGVVRRGTLVWTDAMTEWTAAENVPGLWEGVTEEAPTPAEVIGYESANPSRLRYAGFWLRFVAFLIDGTLVGIANAIIARIFAAIVGVFHTSRASPAASAFAFHFNTFVGTHATTTFVVTPAAPPLGPSFFAYLLGGNLIGIVAAWLYYALMESSRHQASLGKMALRLYVTDLGENPITFGRATGRYFGKILSNLTLCIGFVMAAFTKKKQALHDLLAGTLVLRRQVGETFGGAFER